LGDEVVSKHKKKEQLQSFGEIMSASTKQDKSPVQLEPHTTRAESFKKAECATARPKTKPAATAKLAVSSAEPANLSEFLANIGLEDVEKMFTDKGIDLKALKDSTETTSRELVSTLGRGN